MKKLLVVGKMFPIIEEAIEHYSNQQEKIEIVVVKNVMQAEKTLHNQKINGIALNSINKKGENFIRRNEEILYSIPILICLEEEEEKEMNINYPQILAYITKNSNQWQKIYYFLEYI